MGYIDGVDEVFKTVLVDGIPVCDHSGIDIQGLGCTTSSEATLRAWIKNLEDRYPGKVVTVREGRCYGGYTFEVGSWLSSLSGGGA